MSDGGPLKPPRCSFHNTAMMVKTVMEWGPYHTVTMICCIAACDIQETISAEVYRAIYKRDPKVAKGGRL